MRLGEARPGGVSNLSSKPTWLGLKPQLVLFVWSGEVSGEARVEPGDMGRC